MTLKYGTSNYIDLLFQFLYGDVFMKVSARNRLPGTVKEVKPGTVMAVVLIQVGDNVIESAITKDAVDDLGLKAGDKVTVMIKSTSVMIMK
ncbi:MAG: TOBE domain-containing protein [Methanocella sp.]